MPNQHPSRTLPPSFVPPSILTYVFSPHSRRPLRLGFFPKAASYGVIPTTALVVVLLSNHTTCRPASAHKFFGNPLACNNARMRSAIVQLRRSATPACRGRSAFEPFPLT